MRPENKVVCTLPKIWSTEWSANGDSKKTGTITVHFDPAQWSDFSRHDPHLFSWAQPSGGVHHHFVSKRFCCLNGVDVDYTAVLPYVDYTAVLSSTTSRMHATRKGLSA